MLISAKEANCRRMTLESVQKATGRFKVLVQWLLDEYDTREAVIAKIEEELIELDKQESELCDLSDEQFGSGEDVELQRIRAKIKILRNMLTLIRNPKGADSSQPTADSKEEKK